MQAIEKDGAVVQVLRARRQVILDNIRDNDELGVQYQMVMHLLFAFKFFSPVVFVILLILCPAGNRS